MPCSVTDQQACYDLGYAMYETRCALYKASDRSCHLKTKTCDDPDLGVNKVPNGEFTAIKLCFHCHKTPQWWWNTKGSAKFDFRDKDDGIVKWDQGSDVRSVLLMLC
jgi:hypothetical protein